MADSLERGIRELWNKSGALDRDEVVWILRSLLDRIQRLEEKLADAAPKQREPEWIPVTDKLLNEQHPWLYKPMWIFIKTGGAIVTGVYEWHQGPRPDRFITHEQGEIWAHDASHVMPIALPQPPAAHGLGGKK